MRMRAGRRRCGQPNGRPLRGAWTLRGCQHGSLAEVGVHSASSVKGNPHAEEASFAPSANGGARAGAGADDAPRPGAIAEEAHDGTEKHAHDRAAQVVIPGEQLPDPMGQTQDPLAHGHAQKHVVGQVRREHGRPPGSTARAEAAAFAGERDESVRAARRTPETREARRQPAAAQVRGKLLLHEPWQPLAAAQADRLRPERLEMFAHDAVDPARAGSPRAVGIALSSHALEPAQRLPGESVEILRVVNALRR